MADVSSNVAAVKRDAGSSSKAAGLAIDNMVARAIEKGQMVKETIAGGMSARRFCIQHKYRLGFNQAQQDTQLR